MTTLWQNRGAWGLVGLLGFLLSPLSWWNDLWVNIPIAYGVATVVAWFRPGFFLPVLAAVYWLTNLLGLILLHAGARGVLVAKPSRQSFWLTMLQWFLISLAYTLGIIALYQWGFLRPLETYFKWNL